MAAKLRAGSPNAVAPILLATCLLLLVLAATVVASARPLKLSSSGGDCVRTVESPAGNIQTVVGTSEHDGAAGRRGGYKFMSIDMLRGIKDSGPSPGAGH